MAAALVLIAGAVGAGMTFGGLATAAFVLLAAAPLPILLVPRLGFNAILVWIALEGIATPYLRFPESHALVTFDRAWIPLTLLPVLLTAQRKTHAPVTRGLGLALLLLVAAIGLRAVFTTPAALQRYAMGLWVDAILLPALLYFAIRAHEVTPTRLRQAAGAFALAGAILGLVALLEKVFGFELATRSGGTVFVDPDVGIRYSGPYGQPDMLAVALLICLAMTLFWLQMRRPVPSFYGLVALALELTGIWLTYFRGAWIATLVVVIICLGLRPRRHVRLLGFTGLALVIGVLTFMQIGDSGVGLSARVAGTQNISGRLATYEYGLQLAAQHLWAGVGVAAYNTAAQAGSSSVRVAGVTAAAYPHNIYLDVFAEDGILSLGILILLTAIVVRLVHQFRRDSRDRPDVLFGATLVAVSLAYLILGLEENTILQAPPNILFAACLGLGAARLDALSRVRASVSRGSVTAVRQRAVAHRSSRAGAASALPT